MGNLLELVESLKREIAVPGEFEATFPNTSEDDLLAVLADAWGEARLDGYFSATTLDRTDPADPAVSPDLSAAGGALIVIYSGMRILRAQLRAQNSSQRYKAGPVEYETSKSANLMRDELALLMARKKDLLLQARSSGRTVYVLDGYLARSAIDWGALGGFYPYEHSYPSSYDRY